MQSPLLPGRMARWVVAAVPVAALVAGAVEGSLHTAWRFFLGAVGAAAFWAVIDVARTVVGWWSAPLHWQRRLPTALALGVRHTMSCALVNTGPYDWWVDLAEAADPDLEIRGLPLSLYVPGHSRIELHYTIVARRRGTLRFGRPALVVRTLQGSFRWRARIGQAEPLRVYPDYTLLARYDALAQAGRLADIGIRVPPRSADDVHDTDIDVLWLMLDAGAGLQQRFEEALAALLLLAHVALRAGDAVGAVTIRASGEEPGIVAPHRGRSALNTLMAALHDVQSRSASSDFPSAAAALMGGQRGRARVVVLTGVRDRGTNDLNAALRLLRTRHEVWVAGGAGDPSPLGAALVNRYLAARTLNPPVSASRR